MIFVTVGNATQGFRRLLDAVDRLAGQRCFKKETVFIQSGNDSIFHALHCVQEAFLPMENFMKVICEADLVICHAGAGTLLHVLQAGKVPVVMPRRKQYGEHVDDHQVDLARELASKGRLIPAYEPDDLPIAIAEARRRRSVQEILTPPSRMISLVSHAIEELVGKE